MTELAEYINEAVLLQYLEREVPGLGTVRRVERITSGSSNEIFELSTDDRQVILRRPPRQKLSASAHDVGREFRVGDARLRGVKLAEPCAYLDGKTRPGVRAALIHRGGLRAEILEGGTLRLGDRITAP